VAAHKSGAPFDKLRVTVHNTLWVCHGELVESMTAKLHPLLNGYLEGLFFETGGRYRNRLGWYEVLSINGNILKVRYESDGREDSLDIATQKRIIQNMSLEEQRVIPYADHIRNETYFRTLGCLSVNCFIEAIIPFKSKSGFDKTFMRIKGRIPCRNEQGYYIHNDPSVDKWGIEMRLTFPIRDTTNLDFGGSYVPVRSPDPTELRINSNELCYHLLSMGFNLGKMHDIKTIRASIPERYRGAFEEGIG
jgi:hypothetical protein